MREAFEKWWESFHETEPWTAWDSLYVAGHDYYVDEEIDGQYDSWKASREAIEIDLPELAVDHDKRLRVETSVEGAFNLGVIRSRQAITSHGIRIKGKTE